MADSATAVASLSPRDDQVSANETRAGSPLVEAVDIGVRGGGRWLIRHIDLSVRPGEIVTVIGPNGSGKSTLVKTVLGVLRPAEGKVARKSGLRVGYVPQRLSVDWTLPLTVDRLIRLTGPVPEGERKAALEAVGIPHLARAEVRTLSGGEFQRALLARAIARKPDLLVLDEPVQGVDVAGEVALYALIDEIRHKTGCGILMISHDLHVVMAATDTVLCLNGHVCCSGTPQSVAEDPAYRALFGARAAASIAVYAHHHDHTHLPDGRVRHADGSIADGCHHDIQHDGHEHAAPDPRTHSGKEGRP
ncbi:MAG: metal ABC transporter ATP-binding protein [Alphaproteobacteria bacterium]|nr:metal ABC transporter ATP-binding protein [Alphaproteobacteria bacterium]